MWSQGDTFNVVQQLCALFMLLPQQKCPWLQALVALRVRLDSLLSYVCLA
jgi:hypothetical protein